MWFIFINMSQKTHGLPPAPSAPASGPRDSSGQALIAFLPPKAQRTLIDNIELTSYTDQTISSKERFIAQLEQIKKQGYATEFAELGHLTACCSVPILDSQGNAVAAISLADIAESNENYLQMANDLKAAAAEISKIVAYTQN